MDKYYQDVEIDLESIEHIPYQPTDVSNRLHYVNFDISDSKGNDSDIDGLGIHQLESHPSSFIFRIPNAQ